MLKLLRILAIVSVWSVVGSVIYFVEPETIKDIGIQGSYVVFVTIFALATAYTSAQLFTKWKWLAFTVFVTLIIFLLLLL